MFRHLYVHIPFCTRRCSYCDFSIAVRKDVPAAEFSTSVGTELSRRVDAGGLDQVDTLYFGGGTPSKLGPAGVASLISRLKSGGLTLAPGAEVTLEANPEDLSGEAVSAWMSKFIEGMTSPPPAETDA